VTLENTATSSFATLSDMTVPASPAQRSRQKAAPLTDTALKALKPRDQAYKVTDSAGMYVVVTPTGSKSFRFDYRFDGKRQTLTVGQYEPGTPNRGDADLQALDYGAALSLNRSIPGADARCPARHGAGLRQAPGTHGFVGSR
jgi:hypothetical protein